MNSSGQVTGLPDTKVLDKKPSVAPVPFLCDPAKKLVDNHGHAKMFYEDQVKTLSNKANEREQIITTKEKLSTICHDPPEHLCDEEKSISIAGMKCFPKSDQRPSINDLNFGERCRGKNPENSVGIILPKVSDASENNSWVKEPPWTSRRNSEFSVKTFKLHWIISLIIFMLLFCVPVIVKISPLSHAFVNDTHGYDPNANFSGIETTWRQMSFTDAFSHNEFSKNGVNFQPYHVGAHYMHGKVERDIKDIQITISNYLHKNNHLSNIQWEIRSQVLNTLINLSITMGNVARDLEHPFDISQPTYVGQKYLSLSLSTDEYQSHIIHHIQLEVPEKSSSFTLSRNHE